MEAAPQASASEDEDDTDFRKSFLKTRVVVGVIGVLLSPVVVLGDRWIFDGGWRPTLSDYYYSDMRNWFVGSLWAIGSGLLIYLAARRNALDSVISFVAGLLAMGVALCPTDQPPDVPASLISTLHVVFAGILFVLLAVISFFFGYRDGKRPHRTRRWQRVWRFVHMGCAVVILLAIVVSVVLGSRDAGGSAVLIGETVAVTAFGISWFLKGSELFNLLRADRDRPALLRAPAP